MAAGRLWAQSDPLESYRIQPKSLDFEDRYRQELVSSSLTFADQFGPASTISWIRKIDRDGYSIYDDITRAGTGALSDTAVYALRETAVGVWPLDQWEDFPRELVVGSLGNTAEERIDPLSTAYAPTETSWWRRMRDEGTIQYGIRPFRTNPYVYASAVWRGHGGRPIAYFHARCYYTLLRSEKISGQIEIPLSNSWRISVGGEAVPSKLDGDRSNRSMTFRIERAVLSSAPAKLFMFAGLRVDGQSLTAEAQAHFTF